MRRVSVKKRKRNGHKILLLLCLVFFGLFLWIFLRTTNNPINSKIFPTVTPLPVKTVTHYFLPVVSFDSEITNISAKDLAKSKLFTINENVDIFPDGFQAEVVDLEKLNKELENDGIAILTPDQMKPNWKVVDIDDKNVFESFDEDYVLKYIEKRPGEIGEEDNLAREDFWTIFAAGEIIPARAVDRIGLDLNNNYTYLFDDFAQDIKTADLAIAQLENPVLGDPSPCTGCVVFVSDERVIKGLKTVGFDILAASGNHMGDGLQPGYKRTQELLNKENLKYSGMGKGDSELLKPAIIDLNGRRIGMLSADDVAYFYWSEDPDNFSTNRFSKVVNSIVVPDHERIKEIRKIKETNDIDFLIIYESWGVEYTNNATTHQRDLAHAFIDNGADLIIASHPHWVQNIEFYKDKLIIYSLGNFIFDQTHTLETRQAAALNLTFYGDELKNIEFMPLQTCGYHQTSNNLTEKYLNDEIELKDIPIAGESSGCVYWMPRKLNPENPQYQQIMKRILEYSIIGLD